MNYPIVNCVDITGYNPDLPGVDTLHFADVGGIYGGVYYAERLKQPANFTCNLFSPGKTSGPSQVGSGETVLMNPDGALDYLINWGFDGRAILFKSYTVAAGLVLIMGCSVEQPTFKSDEVSILTNDNQSKLDVPIQPTKYAGTNSPPNGIEGSDDIKGRPKPLTFGTAPNVTPAAVNRSLLIYQGHESACAIPAVYDMGVPLARGADYADQTAMEATAPDVGTYRVCPSLGCFRLGSAPAGQITCDVVEGATAADRTAAQVAKRIALRAISSGEISSADVTALDALNSAEVGIHINAETTVLAALDQVLGSIGGWSAFDVNGVLRMGRLEVPSGAPDLALTGDDCLDLERVASNDDGRGVPPYKVNLQYQKNYTIQGDGIVGPGYWEELPGPFSGLSGFNPLAVHNDYLYVFGGLGFPAVVSRMNLKDISLGWDDSGVTDLPVGRTVHAVAVYGNYAYVVGGNNGTADTASVIRLNLNAPTGAWDDAGVTDLPAPRTQHACLIHDHYLYVVGGKVSGVISSSVIRLDLSNPAGAWDDAGVTDLPAARRQFASAIYGNYLYIAGGQDSANQSVNTMISLDLSNPTGAWENNGALPVDGTLPAWALVQDHFYLIGNAGVNDLFLTRVSLQDHSSLVWEPGLPQKPPGYLWQSAIGYNGRIFVVGNAQVHGTSNSMLVYYENSLSADTALAGAVDYFRRLWLAKEFRTVTDSDASILTAHLLAPEMNVTTLLIDPAAAQTECTRRLNLHKVRRDMFQVVVPSSEVNFIQPGKVLLIYNPRYGLSAGKLFIIIGIAIDWEQKKTTLIIWG